MRTLTLLLVLGAASLQAAPRAWRPGDRLDRVVVQWRGDLSRAELDAEALRLGLTPGAKSDPVAALHRRAAATPLRRTPILDIDVLALSPGGAAAVDAALAVYRASPLVLFAEPDAPIRRASAPNDTLYSAGLQKGLSATAWPQAWEAYQADAFNFSQAVTVAVLDTGVDPHNDLPVLLAGQSFVDGEPSTDDLNGHGTFVSGLIAALPNNGSGISGAFVDPAFVKLLPVKVLDACGDGAYSDVSSGILWAVQAGAKVLNLSLSGGDDSDIMRASLNAAQGAGAVVVAAAGNDSGSTGWPAAYPMVISVSALNSAQGLAWYSNFGKVELSAPGGDGDNEANCIASPSYFANETWSLSAWTSSGLGCAEDCSSNANFNAWAGTSFSAPLVAAAAAMLMAKEPALSPVQVQQRLIQSAAPTSLGSGFNSKTGWGKLDFYRALTLGPASGPGSALRAYNWPNPYWPNKDASTQFSFFLPAQQAVELRLLDAGGDLVKRWSLGAHETWVGMNIVSWDGLNGSGRSVAAGGYLLVVESGGQRVTHRVAVLK